MGNEGAVAESRCPCSANGDVRSGLDATSTRGWQDAHMTRARPTASKRNVQQHKREKARAKQERRAARRIEDPLVDTIRIQATEEELIDELAALHRAVETATISPDEFESRREVIRLQLEQIARDIP